MIANDTDIGLSFIEKEFANALKSQEILLTPECLESSPILSLIKNMTPEPLATEQMLHVLFCANCRNQMQALETKWVAEKNLKSIRSIELRHKMSSLSKTVFSQPALYVSEIRNAVAEFRAAILPEQTLSFGTAKGPSLTETVDHNEYALARKKVSLLEQADDPSLILALNVILDSFLEGLEEENEG